MNMSYMSEKRRRFTFIFKCSIGGVIAEIALSQIYSFTGGTTGREVAALYVMVSKPVTGLAPWFVCSSQYEEEKNVRR